VVAECVDGEDGADEGGREHEDEGRGAHAPVHRQRERRA
jgi:hypothetical protein